SPTRSAHHPGNQPKMPPTPNARSMRPHVKPSPHNGSASSTPSLNPNNGGPCNATSDAANTSKTPSRPSPDWSPTAAPSGNNHHPLPPTPHALPQSCTTSLGMSGVALSVNCDTTCREK